MLHEEQNHSQGKGWVPTKDLKEEVVACSLGTAIVEKTDGAVMAEGEKELEGRKAPIKVNLKEAGINRETNHTMGTQSLRERVLRNKRRGYRRSW